MKYLIALRPFSFIATFIPVTVGALIAQQYSSFSLWLYLISLVAAICVHAGVNTSNDYFDYKNGVDRPDTLGSSGLLVKKVISLKEIMIISLVMFSTGIALGFLLVSYTGFNLLWFGLIGIIGGYFYTAKPLNLKYRGFGLPLVFLLMGPFMVMGAEYVQARRLSLSGLIVSIPIGIATVLILLANEIRDTQDDRKVGLKSLPILIGDLAGTRLYLFLVLLQYLMTAILIFTNVLSRLSWLSLFALPVYLAVYHQLSGKAYKKFSPEDISGTDKKTAMAEMIFGASLIIGLL